jgi:hypothetical protein
MSATSLTLAESNEIYWYWVSNGISIENIGIEVLGLTVMLSICKLMK